MPLRELSRSFTKMATTKTRSNSTSTRTSGATTSSHFASSAPITPRTKSSAAFSQSMACSTNSDRGTGSRSTSRTIRSRKKRSPKLTTRLRELHRLAADAGALSMRSSLPRGRLALPPDRVLQDLLNERFVADAHLAGSLREVVLLGERRIGVGLHDDDFV